MTIDLMDSLAIGYDLTSNAHGSWSESSNKYDICFAGIFHQLICEAARMCTTHASDIYYDLKTIEKELEMYMKNETKYYFYGFYRDGVANLLKSGTEDDLRELDKYRSIWVLKICKEGRFVNMELIETKAFSIRQRYKEILEVTF